MKKIVFNKEDFQNQGYYPHYFISEEGELVEGVQGFGEVEYVEGSIYRGSLICHNGILEKYGYGEQDFRNSTIEVATSKKGGKVYKFIGQYDYRFTQWICGDGILYFVDKDDKPFGYVKGNFRALEKVGPYLGHFTNDILLPGFAETEELDILPFNGRFDEEKEEAKNVKKAEIVMIGDSWFEFYRSHQDKENYEGTFYQDTEGLDIVDLGIGGTTYADWNKELENVLKGFVFNKMVVNLGFNDIHANRNLETVFEDFKTFLSKVYALNPQAKIYINAVCPSLTYQNFLDKEKELNCRLKEYCQTNDIEFISVDEEFASVDLKEIYAPDGIHLNKFGYRIWAPKFLKKISD